ncbi:MAG: hypothetical protein ACRCXD_09770 [Luteolibacter sp.]
MKFLVLLVLFVAAALLPAREMLIVVSEPGDGNYDTEFRRQAKAWQNLAAKGEMSVQTIGLEAETQGGDHVLVGKKLTALAKTGDDLWLILIGHGSFDGRTANFNLRGPDIDPVALQGLLKPFTRRLVILNLFSASSSFLAPLAGENRVVVSAVRGQGQRNYSRFGAEFADALTDPAADLDLSGSLSLLEATLHATAGTRAFYENAQRVLQENAIIDDNGDGEPTPTDDFQGLRAATGNDGLLAREIYFFEAAADPLSAGAQEMRAKLETSIDALRKRKAKMKEDEYYTLLESLMREMARLYEQKP